MKVGKIGTGDIPNRKAKYNVGPRLPPDGARKQLRAAVLVALADAPGPITAFEIWQPAGRPAVQPLSDVLDELVGAGLIERTERRLAPVGPLTTHFSLTAREG